MSSCNKWQVSNTITLCGIFSSSNCAPLWKWHAIRRIIYTQRRKFINFKLHICHIWTWYKTRHSRRKLVGVCCNRLILKCHNIRGNTETRQYPCHWAYHVLREQKFNHFQGVGCCCLFLHWQICVCWLFESSNGTKIVVITQNIWRYIIWWTLRSWHTRNFI